MHHQACGQLGLQGTQIGFCRVHLLFDKGVQSVGKGLCRLVKIVHELIAGFYALIDVVVGHFAAKRIHFVKGLYCCRKTLKSFLVFFAEEFVFESGGMSVKGVS